LNASGSALIYSTYLGGSSYDQTFGIAVDGSGNAYVTGETTSTDFPTTTGAFQASFTAAGYASEAFVTELNATGTGLNYSTFLGGYQSTVATAIALDASDDAYITGFTNAGDFPTTAGAFQTTIGNSEQPFVTKLNPTGAALIYSTFLGGGSIGSGYSISVDGSGDAYVTGYAGAGNFSTTSDAFQATGENDAFLSKLNAGGTGLIYSTYFGAGFSEGSGIALDASGNAYVVGFSQSTNFPTTSGAFQSTFGGGANDAFVAKFDFSVSATTTTLVDNGPNPIQLWPGGQLHGNSQRRIGD
jgi:hypothetical protein